MISRAADSVAKRERKAFEIGVVGWYYGSHWMSNTISADMASLEK